jgi:uncharacterized protein YbjT (DUF2867 family)
MKITITGSLGNVSKPLAEMLVKNNHEVTVISSDANKINNIKALGAKPAIGSIADVDFLTDSFTNADAIYTMVPPNMGIDNFRQYMAETGKNYLHAIKASGVKKVVNLSSIGAHLSERTGPIAGLYDVEHTLNTLDGVAIRHLRAGFFYTNFFYNIGMIRSLGIMGNNYGSHTKIVMAHPIDIATAAAQELEGRFNGKSHRYVVSEECEVIDIAKILGASINKPDLAWVQFSDEEAYTGMASAGMPAALAKLYVEMGNAIGSGIIFKDFEQHKPEVWGSIKFTDFAKEFATVYNSQN